MISEMCNMDLGQTHCLCQSMSSWKYHNYRPPLPWEILTITYTSRPCQPSQIARSEPISVFKKQFVANKVEMLQWIMQWSLVQRWKEHQEVEGIESPLHCWHTCLCRWITEATPDMPVAALALVKWMLITLNKLQRHKPISLSEHHWQSCYSK